MRTRQKQRIVLPEDTEIRKRKKAASYIIVGPTQDWLVGWLVWGFNGPLRQYFSLYRAVSQREGERGKEGYVQTTPTRTYCKCSRPLPYCNPNSRTPRHWKFTQHHCTTRPPLPTQDILGRVSGAYRLPITVGLTERLFQSLLTKPWFDLSTVRWLSASKPSRSYYSTTATP